MLAASLYATGLFLTITVQCNSFIHRYLLSTYNVSDIRREAQVTMAIKTMFRRLCVTRGIILLKYNQRVWRSLKSYTNLAKEATTEPLFSLPPTTPLCKAYCIKTTAHIFVDPEELMKTQWVWVMNVFLTDCRTQKNKGLRGGSESYQQERIMEKQPPRPRWLLSSSERHSNATAPWFLKGLK